MAGCCLLFVMALPASALAAPIWSALYTGPAGTESQEANAVAGAADGSIYVAGDSTYTFGQPDLVPWLVKYTADGSLVWEKAPTDVAAHGVFLGLTVFPNQDALAWGQSGRNASGFLVARYRPDGTRRWAIKIPGGFSATRPSDAVIDPRGYIYLAGTDGTGDLGAEGLLLKLTTSGHLLWRRVISGDVGSGSALTALALGSKGNLYASGSVVRRGSPRWFVASYTPTGKRRWADTSIIGGGQDITFAHGVVYAGGIAQARSGANPFALLRAYTFRGRLLFGRQTHAEPGLAAGFDYLTIDAAGSLTIAPAKAR